MNLLNKNILIILVVTTIVGIVIFVIGGKSTSVNYGKDLPAPPIGLFGGQSVVVSKNIPAAAITGINTLLPMSPPVKPEAPQQLEQKSLKGLHAVSVPEKPTAPVSPISNGVLAPAVENIATAFPKVDQAVMNAPDAPEMFTVESAPVMNREMPATPIAPVMIPNMQMKARRPVMDIRTVRVQESVNAPEIPIHDPIFAPQVFAPPVGNMQPPSSIPLSSAIPSR